MKIWKSFSFEVMTQPLSKIRSFGLYFRTLFQKL